MARNTGLPTSDLEERILGVWQEALGTRHVGTDDNFFDVGGHSLLLTRVQMKLHETLEMEIPMVRLYQYPTVRSLAHNICASASPAVSQAARRGEARRKLLLAQAEARNQRTDSASRPN